MTSDSALRIARHCDDLAGPPHFVPRAHHRGACSTMSTATMCLSAVAGARAAATFRASVSRVRRATKTGGEAIGVARRAPARAARLVRARLR